MTVDQAAKKIWDAAHDKAKAQGKCLWDRVESANLAEYRARAAMRNGRAPEDVVKEWS